MSSFQICSVDKDLPGCRSHDCLVEVKAQVMIRDNALGMWMPHSGGGMSRVGLFQAPDPAERADVGCIQYLINGYRMSDDVVILHCVMSTDFQYTKVNPTFHHWSVEDKRFGLTFQTFADATAFEKTISLVMEKLRSTGANTSLPSRGGTSSCRSSPKDTLVLHKETEKTPRLPLKMHQRQIAAEPCMLPNWTHYPGSCSQTKDSPGSICSLENIHEAITDSSNSALPHRSSSAEVCSAAPVVARRSSSDTLAPSLSFISSQSEFDSRPQLKPRERRQPCTDVAPQSKSDCGLETQPLVHSRQLSRTQVVAERSRLSANKLPLPTRCPSPKLHENAIPFPYMNSPITPKVVVEYIDKKRPQTPLPPVPLRPDETRRPRYETKQSQGLVSSGTSGLTWDDVFCDDLHQKLVSVPAAGRFIPDPAAIYVTSSSYVHFTKDRKASGYPEKDEYSYPNLDAVTSVPPASSHRGVAIRNAYRDYRNLEKTNVQPPVPPLPMKSHQRHAMNRSKESPRKPSDLYRSDSANFKSKCTYCGEYFSPKENRRGACADGPDAFRDCAKNCVCPAAALVYHCADEEDGVATDLWTCGSHDRRSCRQQTVLAIVCLLLPCMWCFLPMRACHHCGVACGCCGARHQAALPLASNV